MDTIAFVRTRLKSWGVKHWCCTLEAASTGTLHIHLYVQFHRQVDKTTQSFIFEGISPRADTNDYLGQGQGKRNAQQSMDRGFFYIFADKIGTQRDEHGNEVLCVTATERIRINSGGARKQGRMRAKTGCRNQSEKKMPTPPSPSLGSNGRPLS